MSDEYQLRKDIDRLNDLAWSTADGQSKLVDKETFDELKRRVDEAYLDNDNSDIKEQINEVSDTVDTIDVDISDVREIIGDENSGLVKQVNTNTTNISTTDGKVDTINNSTIPTINGRVESVETTVGDSSSGLVKQVNTIDATVGDNSSGLVKQVNDIDGTVGNSSSGLVKIVTTHTSQIGDVDVATDGSLQSQITTTDGRVESVETTVGDSSSGLVKQVNTIDATVGDNSSGLVKQVNDIDDTVEDVTTNEIPNVKTKMGYSSIPSGSSLQGQLTTHDGQIGDVDVDVNEDLQTQIIKLINMMKDLFITVGRTYSVLDVTEETIVITVGGVERTYYTVPSDYPYELIYCESTDEYFQKADVTLNGEDYVVWDWISNPYTSQFKNTMLYEVMANIFTERTIPLDEPSVYIPSEYDYSTVYTDSLSLKFQRQFNIVTCYYHIYTKTITDTNDKPILVENALPVGFRPSETFYQTISNYAGTMKHGLISIFSNGSMAFRMGVTNTSMNVYGELTYIVED